MNVERNINNEFFRINKLFHTKFHQGLQEIGLHPGQPFLLKKLMENDGEMQKQLADSLMVTPATINKMIKRMENVGLIKRERDKDDSRIVRIYLTRRGRELGERAEKIIQKSFIGLMYCLEKEEKEELLEILKKIEYK